MAHGVPIPLLQLLAHFFLHVKKIVAFCFVEVGLDLAQFDPLVHIQRALRVSPIDDRSELKDEGNVVEAKEYVLVKPMIPIQHEILRHNFRQAVFDLNCGHVKVKAEEDVEDDDPFVFVEVVAFVIAVNILIVLEFLRVAKA